MDQQQEATSIDPISDWRVSWKLLLCPKCNSKKTCENKEAAAAPMLFIGVTHMCSANCFCNCSICIECSNVRKPFFTERQQKRHHKSRHNHDPLMMHQMEDSGAHNNKWVKIRSQEGCVTSTNPSNTQNRVTFPFSNQESWNYFEREHLHGLGTAYQYANSQFKLDLVAPNLHKEDVLLQAKLAELISSLTLGQQIKFTEVMYQQNKVNQLHQPSHGNKSWLSYLPPSYPDLRRLFLKGKHAFLPNLPRPPVNTLKEHS